MARRQLSKKDRKEINIQLEESYGLREFISKKDTLAIVDERLLFVNGTAKFFLADERYVPLLKLLLERAILPEVTVDMGAVKFMVSGADVMRPGITKLPEEIEQGDMVVIVDENNRKPLCVAKAIYKGDEIQELVSGKTFKNLHWIGDDLWNY